MMLSNVRTFHVWAWPDAISAPWKWSLSSECSPGVGGVGLADVSGEAQRRTHVVEVHVLGRVVVVHADGGVERVHLAPKVGEGLVERPVVRDAKRVHDTGGGESVVANVPCPILFPKLVRAPNMVLGRAVRLPILDQGEDAGGQVGCTRGGSAGRGRGRGMHRRQSPARRGRGAQCRTAAVGGGPISDLFGRRGRGTTAPLVDAKYCVWLRH